MNGYKCQLVVVLGMHRSGTSATTRGLQALGVALGESLTPAVPGVNDKGFFEDIEINRINIELLEFIGSDWHSLSLISESCFQKDGLESIRRRAKSLISLRIKNGLFGLKDPRIARLLPFWISVFSDLGVDVYYVVAIRNPLSVAKSLLARDGMQSEKSYYLWLEHVIPSVLMTKGFGTVVVDFDGLIADPSNQLRRIASALGLPFSADCDAVREYINEFLDAGLRHTSFNLNDLSRDLSVPQGVVETFELLVRLARDEIAVDAQEVQDFFVRQKRALEDISPALDYMTRSDQRISLLEGEVSRLHQSLDQSSSHVSWLKQTVADQIEHILMVRQEWAARGAHIDQLATTIDTLRDTLQKQLERTEQVTNDWADRGEQIEKFERIADALRDSLQTQLEYTERVATDWADRGEHIEELAHTIDTLRDELGKQVEHTERVSTDWAARGEHIEELAHTIDTLRDGLGKQVEYTEQLNNDWAARGEHIEQLAHIIAALRDGLEKQVEYTERVEKDWAARGEHIEVLAHTVVSLRDELGKQVEYTEQVKKDWAARGVQIDHLAQSINTLEGELNEFRSSWYGVLGRSVGKIRQRLF